MASTTQKRVKRAETAAAEIKHASKRQPSKAKRKTRVLKEVTEIQPGKTYDNEFRQRMVSMMLEQKLSANQLSEQTGVSQPTLSRWMRQAEAKANGGTAPAKRKRSTLAALKDRILVLVIPPGKKTNLLAQVAEALG